MANSLKNCFVPVKLALKIKNKNFNEECLAWYNYESLQFFGNDLNLDKYANTETKPIAPLYEQCLTWLRVKYGYHILIDQEKLELKSGNFSILYSFRIFLNGKIITKYPDIRKYDTYYNSLNNAISTTLDLI